MKMKFDKKLFRKKKFWQVTVMTVITVWFAVMVFNRPDWRTADMSSSGLAPKPEETSEAVVQVYAARTFSWRGYFSVHTWVATKEKDAPDYMVYQVVGFYLRQRGNVIFAEKDIPDRKWYGAMPYIIQELRGEVAEQAIPKIREAAFSYPFARYYSPWPGPNSNSFVAHIIRSVPELTVELPPNAIGKDWIEDGKIFGPSESGTGFQISLFGLLGITVGKAEGFEVNVLGLDFGVDFLNPAIKLPLIGRVGFKDEPID